MEGVKKFGVILLALIVAGLLGYPIKSAVSINRDSVAPVRASIGSGSLFAILGGYRSLVADIVWIKSFVNWMHKDISKCVANIDLACAIEPEMTSFWTQGATIIAYDVPHWIHARLPKEQRSLDKLFALRRSQAREAIAFLDKAIAMFPKERDLYIQQAKIAMMVDYNAEAEMIVRDLLKIDKTIYVQRLYIDILIRNKKVSEAKICLQNLVNELSPKSPIRADVIEQLKSLK